jgi:4-hydroxybenzoate polyprenyltransferase
MSTVKNYLSLIKFSHTIFAMPFALIGFFLASHERVMSWLTDQFRDYHPSSWSVSFGEESQKPLWQLFLLVLICMITARSAAMAFNRYLDRRWDALNPRTAVREIPKGIITPKNALVFTIISCLLFIAATWFLNRICFYLSPLPLQLCWATVTPNVLPRFAILFLA